MKLSDTSGFFSLADRRQIEAEKVKARREAEAQAARVVARLANERRLQAVHEVVAKAEVRALGRLFRGDLSALWELAKSIVKRLRDEDRSATLAAADEVAQALEDGHGRGKPAAALARTNGTSVRPESEEDA